MILQKKLHDTKKSPKKGLLKSLKLKKKKPIKGLLETGTDRSYIADKDWPSAWPVTKTSYTLLGLKITNNIVKKYKNKNINTYKNFSVLV